MNNKQKLIIALAVAGAFVFGSGVACPVLGQQGTTAPVASVVKQPWSERHPKLHKHGRRLRKICVASMPVLQAAANIGTAVGGFSVPFKRF